MGCFRGEKALKMAAVQVNSLPDSGMAFRELPQLDMQKDLYIQTCLMAKEPVMIIMGKTFS